MSKERTEGKKSKIQPVASGANGLNEKVDTASLSVDGGSPIVKKRKIDTRSEEEKKRERDLAWGEVSGKVEDQLGNVYSWVLHKLRNHDLAEDLI